MGSGISTEKLNLLKEIVEDAKDVLAPLGVAKILFVYNDDYPEDGYITEVGYYSAGSAPEEISRSKIPSLLLWDLRNAAEEAVETIQFPFQMGGGGEVLIQVEDQSITHTWYENRRIDHPEETF